MALCMVRLAAIIEATPARLAALTPDDAYYYFAIARNIASGGGSTFDGMHPTNGYHPLWMIVCSTLALLCGADSSSVADLHWYAGVVLLVQACGGVAALALLALACKEFLRDRLSVAMVFAAGATPWVIYGMTDGMESVLVQFSIAGVWITGHSFRPFTSPPSSRDVAFGALLGVVVLARLDLALLPMAIGCVATVLWAKGAMPWSWLVRKGAAWGVPVAITLGVYLFLNSLHFDSALPISGMLKSSFPVAGFHAETLHAHAIPILVGLGTIALAAWLAGARELDAEFRVLLLCGAGFIGMHLAYTLVYTDWAVHRWYFTAYWLFGAMASAGLVRYLVLRHSRKKVSIAVLAMICGLTALSAWGQYRFLSGRMDRAFQARSFDAALWAREHIQPGRVIGMTDCGVFGYYRGGLVVNLDGVVNTRAYQEALVNGGIRKYLDGAGVDYIAHHAVPAGKVARGYRVYPYRVYSHLYKEPGGEVLLEERREVYRSEVYDDGTGTVVFVIWKRQWGVM